VTTNAIAKLKQQRENINTRIQLAEAREKMLKRKLATRRKILVGAYYIDLAEKENKFDDLKTVMDKFLTRNNDRALFDLKPSES
jgi:hypothetical protein